MMAKPGIKELLHDESWLNKEVQIQGWIRTFRNNQFLAVNDGSCLQNLQLVIGEDLLSAEELKRLTTGASVSAMGTLIPSQGKGQNVEMAVDTLTVLGDSDPEKYPLQPKKHSLEFLRENAHLRMRTSTFGAVFRIRHKLSMAIHKYLDENGYFYMNTPIITAADAEGAGEMFSVTTLPLDSVPKDDSGEPDFSKDFFGTKTHLTVSGQLEGELAALSLGKIYTFGPTFRAENSNTTRHLAEFWMMEPEVAFIDNHGNMDLAEEILHYCINYVLENCEEDLAFLNDRFVKEENQKPQNERLGMSLLEKLEFCVAHPFQRLSYTEAFEILKNSKPNKKGKFKFPVDEWGVDLQSEHERFLVEKHFKKPVILFDYPKTIKAFYMRLNDDNKTVAAMDILFPGIGEIVGGSQREERLDVLTDKMKEMNIPMAEMQWYLDTRRFGTCQHAGFGLGFERLVQFVTGMANIRDVIAFPRYPGSARF